MDLTGCGRTSLVTMRASFASTLRCESSLRFTTASLYSGASLYSEALLHQASLGPELSRNLLVNGSGLDELEERGLGFELCPVGALHLEASGHRAKGRRQRAARGVFEGLAWRQSRLLADDAGTMNFFGMPGAIDDGPMAIEELDGRLALIGNLDRVEKEPATRLWIAVLGRILGANSNADTGRLGLGRCFKEIAFGHGRNSSRHIFCNRRSLRE
jgi:hypothetical protein